MKCDEVKPVCGNCSKGNRACVYPDSASPAEVTSAGPPTVSDEEAARRQRHMQHASFASTSDAQEIAALPPGSGPPGDDATHTMSPRSRYTAFTADGSEIAPLQWFGLLAHDASDVNLDLPPLVSSDGVPRSSSALRTSTEPPRHHAAGSPAVTSAQDVPVVSASVPRSAELLVDEKKRWQSPGPIELQAHKHGMFQRFVTCISLWIDLFDPLKHFSTFVPHLALRNEGLMKALLALGARHLSIKPSEGRDAGVDQTAAVQYYSETLQYLQSAMRYTSYKSSLELLATVLIVSTYEMIDGAGKGWERHLKGVFWIQRSREINGESGGLEQAVWWAWLRQDVWAAFRERRRCFSFFRPTKPYSEMNIWDVASRVVYILAQVVNYSSDEEKLQGEDDTAGRVDKAKTLVDMLDEWRENTSVHFQPLPAQSSGDQPFKPIWVHPSAFGAAMQMYHVARILLLVDQPAAGGSVESYSRSYTIGESVNAIAGIALTMTEDASRVISTQCLFAAGLRCTDQEKRDFIANLITDHTRHTGWPSNTNLAEELQSEWSKGSKG
ncbi:uncharacterized protein LTR77_006836 [Saxophila tyrrhenica]|uniref:Zn(2)-C6 fungal-type domain-containing protein n=1 Tax=Saxophila tyrrhenica TaxID=1690608 RepID=A0AAV9P7Z2_9PEZI|nr:hypothetical protein LTR77_006836 [Saxophila tyrrhenica]